METLSIKSISRQFTYLIVLATFTVVAVSGITLLLPVLLGAWVGYSQSIQSIWIWIASYILVFAMASSLRVYVFSHLAQRVKDYLQNHLRRSLFSHFQAEGVAVYQSRVSDLNLIENTIEQGASQFLRNCLLIIGGLILMVYTSINLTLMIFFILPVCIFPLLYCLRGYRNASNLLNDLEDKDQQLALSFMNYLLPIWYYNRSNWALDKLSHYHEDLVLARSKKLMYRVGITFLGLLFVFLGLALIMYLATGFSFDQQILANHELVRFAVVTLLVAIAASGLSDLLHQISNAMSAFDRLSNQKVSTSSDVNIPQQFEDMTIQSLNYQYPGANESVIADLDIDITKGEKIAVVGVSGVGKSTLLKLILGLIAPDSGEIKINKQNSSMEASWRAYFAFILGLNPVLHSSIRDNLLLGAECDAHAIELALKNMAMDKWQSSHNIFDQMQQASSGQLQRIQAISAIVQDRPILVLDEVSSHCDSDTQKLVHQYLFNLPQTIIVATHQSDLVMRSDRVIFLQNRRAPMIATHHELLQSSKAYQALMIDEAV